MQKHRYKVSFLLTTLLYVLLVAGYLVVQNQHFSVEEKPQEQTIHLSLSEFIPEVILPVEQPLEPEEEVVEEPVIEEPIIEEEVEPEPELEPEVEEPVEEEVIPEPVVEPKPIVKEVKEKPLPKKKKIVKKKKKVKKKKVKKKRVKRKVVKSSRRSVNPAKKSQFFAKVRGKINRAKSYPRIAQKRGMQGSVKVKFTILANGNASNISVSGPKVFHNSARNAVKKAFPISTKNVPISLPQRVNFTLRYQLR